MAFGLSRQGLRIMAATDLSAPADEAIRQAHEWAKAYDGELIVCHVIAAPWHTNALFPQQNEEESLETLDLEENAVQEVSVRVEELTGRSPDGFRLVIESGDPAANVVREAEEEKADLVVVANRGATGIERLLLGTVAERVVGHAHCPVLVARAHNPTGHVLVATDLSDRSAALIDAAVPEARRRGARLSVLHNVDVATLPEVLMDMASSMAGFPVAPRAASQVRDLAAQLVRDFVAVQRIDADCMVAEGDAAASIWRAAEQLPAELVVIGSHGRTGLARLAIGNVAERVVQTASCSVLVVRTAGVGA
jgi:nucleotide-binding universal stress UspA family protein